MTREEIIRNLEHTMEKHKNDIVHTFDTSISVMCKDILDYLKQEPCEDCISRKEAIEFASGACHPANVAKELAKLTPVTPIPRTGHWITLDYQRSKFKCSVCQTEGYVDTSMYEPIWNYCPNCGCRMVELQGKRDKE